MDKLTHVFTVAELADDTPTLLCVCATREVANKAVTHYINDYRHGGTAKDYEVRKVKLNWGNDNG